MYLIREVMHCKPGKAGEMVKRFKQLGGVIKKMGYPQPLRIMTDVSGERYWTVVVEQDADSLEAHAELSRKTMTDPEIQKVMKGYHDLVESGHREIYKIE